MFDIGYSELLIIGIVALVVIGPKDLPRVMRTVGNWVGRMREAELEEMERKWREENDRIMRYHPTPSELSASDDAPPKMPDQTVPTAADELVEMIEEPPAAPPPASPAPPPSPSPAPSPSGELPLSGGSDRPREPS